MEWIETENEIQKYIVFFQKNLHISPYNQNDPIKCNDCLFRQLALLLMTKDIKVKKVEFQKNILPDDYEFKKEKKHGADWHNKKIENIGHYFVSNGYEVHNEPNLFLGKSDLYIPYFSLFIEVGTVGLYKLFYNLLKMEKCKFHIIPNDTYLIEFSL
jgi:hypothetical protein